MKKIISGLAFALPSLLWAQKEIEASAKITNITVYTSAAEVNCEREISLPKGKSALVFTGLSPFISENSIHVSVASPGVNIITVSERINYAREQVSLDEKVGGLQDSILKMKKETGLLKCRSDAAETEKGLLFKNESIGGLSTQGVAVAEIEKASAFFSRRYLELNTQLYNLKEKENELSARIARCQGQLKELETVSVQTTSEIKVLVNTKSEGPVTFHFSYLTPKAGWAPLYDFKYNGPAQPLQFVFRANVFNATGVPWPDVNLRLSTADPVRGFALPALNNKTNTARPAAEVQFRQIEVVNAITEYSIAHQYSLPSDAKPYLVDVDAYSMPAAYNYLLIPSVDPFGFLMAKIAGWNKYNLIPGTSNIYSSGTYMGKTFLDTYAANDTLSLYLGKDKNIQAARSERSVLHERLLAGNYTMEETAIEISLKNNFTEALPVEVLDQVPVFTKDDPEKFTIYNLGNALYNKAEGLLTWRFTLSPGETTAISYKYEIKSPKENYDGSKMKRRKYRTLACPTF